MKKATRLLILLLACAMLLTACGGNGGETSAVSQSGSGETSTPASADTTANAPANTKAPDGGEVQSGGGEVLRVLISNEPSNIMPQNFILGDGQQIAPCIYDTLINFNSETQELEPNVATSWEWVDDTHLRLYLRDDVVAYDGTILTANDVLYSVQCGLSGNAATFWKAVNGDECYVEDDFIFVLGLNQIYPTIAYQLAGHAMLTLLDESSAEAMGGFEAVIRNPKCTTGPYFFDEWKDGEYIRLKRNDNYWGEPGFYETIEFTFNSDNASRVMSLAAGEVDIAVDLASVDIASLEGYDDCYSMVLPSSGVNVLYMNITNEYLSNELVREAIYLTLNVEAMNMLGSGGLAKIATGPYESTSVVYAAPKTPIDRTVNVERARGLMAEAGYADGFTLNMPCQNFTQTMCEAIQADLLKIGINLNLEVVETMAIMQRNDVGEFDLALAQTFTDDPVNVCNYIDDRLALNQRGGGIVGGLPSSYDLIDKCRYSLDEAVRMEGYAELQEYIHENYLLIPFYEYCTVFGTRGEFEFYTNVLGVIKYQTVKPQ